MWNELLSRLRNQIKILNLAFDLPKMGDLSDGLYVQTARAEYITDDEPPAPDSVAALAKLRSALPRHLHDELLLLYLVAAFVLTWFGVLRCIFSSWSFGGVVKGYGGVNSELDKARAQRPRRRSLDLTRARVLPRAQAYYEALARREQTLYHVHWAEQRGDHDEARRLEVRLDDIDKEIDELEEKLDKVEPKKWKAHAKAR